MIRQGQSIWQAARDLGRPVFCVETLESPAIVLGRFQRRQSTLVAPQASSDDTPTVTTKRRLTGGPAIAVWPGTIHLVAAYPDLGESPDPARLLNRHVRKFVRALASICRKPVTTAGRDWVSVGGVPAAWVGVAHERGSQSSLLEAFLHPYRGFALAEEYDLAFGAVSRYLGKIPIGFAGANFTSDDHVSSATILAIKRAYEGWTQIDEPMSIEPDGDDKPAFQLMVEDAIGLMGADIHQGRVTLGGDWMVSDDVMPALELALSQCPLEAVESTLHEHLGSGSGAMCIGLKSFDQVVKLLHRLRSTVHTAPI